MIRNGLLSHKKVFMYFCTACMLLGFLSADAENRKFNPGHYVAINPWESGANKLYALQRPGVLGAQIRYQWKELETSLDNYDFSQIQKDLNMVKGEGRRLVIVVEDKTFYNENPLPAYLGDSRALKNLGGGYTAKRWDPYVVTRFNKLISRLGDQFDSDPFFEGVSIQESATSLSGTALSNNGYTPEKYRDALIAILRNCAASFPTSQTFWFMNFIEQKMAYIGEIADEVAPLGIAMGGPDILPDDYSLNRHAYPYYEQYQDKMTLFGSVQYNSYRHVHKDTSKTTKYWTPWELFYFARDQLHVRYIFWNRQPAPDPSDSYYWIDALPVIQKTQYFGGTSTGSGSADATTSTDWTDSDNDGLPDTRERNLGTNPWKPDTDGDNINDGVEVKELGTNPLLINTDDDGLNDDIEVLYKRTDPLRRDTDLDGLTDGEEASLSGIGTDPLNPDTDGGGVPDGLEVAAGTNPKIAWDDQKGPDTDGDGLLDDVERSLGTSIWKKDTDGDRLTDNYEVTVSRTDPLARNTDKDLIPDGIEVLYKGTNPLNPDSDYDGLSDGEEASLRGLGTDPLNPDTDGDGIADGVEVAKGSNPLVATD